MSDYNSFVEIGSFDLEVIEDFEGPGTDGFEFSEGSCGRSSRLDSFPKSCRRSHRVKRCEFEEGLHDTAPVIRPCVCDTDTISAKPISISPYGI